MEIVIIIALILLNGIFSMSEIAIISARKSNLASEAKRGNKAAQSALDLANKPDKFLSTVQVGITLIGILTGLYSGDVLAGDFALILSGLGLPTAYTYPVAQAIIVLIVTYFTIIFGELVPKKFGLSIAEKIAKVMAKPMNILSRIAYPFVWLLSKTTALVCKVLRIKDPDTKVTEEEIISMIQEGREDGEVQEVEQDIMERVFSLGDRDLESIMTHRSEIVFLSMNMSKEQISETVHNSLYGVYPVVNKNLDDIVGMVYLKDMFGKIDKEDFSLEQLIPPAYYFPENMEVYKALDEMKDNHVKYAIVCDEFGSMQGIVTMKDILEALIGTIPDHAEEPDIIQREDGSWLVDGQCSFYDFLTYFKMTDLYSKNEYNTISGLILELLEHIPQSGEKVTWHVFTFEVVDMDGARIDKILATMN